MIVPLNTLFKVEYGNKLDLNKMEIASDKSQGVNFVGRASRQHGVSARIARLPEIEPYEAGCDVTP